MCVVSNVYDWGRETFPWNPITQPSTTTTITYPVTDPELKEQMDELAGQIEGFQDWLIDFREALEAAKIVDRVTGQPDCVDPDKQKLEERIAEAELRITELERRMDLKRDRVLYGDRQVFSSPNARVIYGTDTGDKVHG